MKPVLYKLIIFLLYSVSVFSQNCLTIEPHNVAASTSSDPAYIKLYIHVIRDDGGNGGVGEAIISDVITELQGQHFVEHSIYISIACVNEIFNSAMYFNPCLIEDYYPTYSINDGLNLYLTQTECVIGSASYFGKGEVGGNNCWANVGTGLDFIASHEVAHNLGLLHTFHIGQSGQLDCADGSSCEIEGDGICDTPADPGNANCIDIDCNWLDSCQYDNRTFYCDTTAYFDFDPTIIMSYYFDCVNRFTAGQAEVMRGIVNEGGLSFVSPGEFVITQNTTWTTPTQFDVDVVVKSPYTLRIEADVQMGPSRKIIVESGATLIVSGATITNGFGAGCDSGSHGNWGGIGISGEYAKVYIQGAIIENAEKGIHYSNEPLSSKYSQVIVTNSFFINNLNSIHLVASQRLPSMAIRAFKTHFVQDSSSSGSLMPQVVLGNVNSTFSSCEVVNESQKYVNTIGVRTFNSVLHFKNSLISGYYTAMHSQSINNSGYPFIIENGSQLVDCHYCLKTEAVDRYRISGSTIKVGSSRSTTHYPIAIEDVEGDAFRILGNTIEKQQGLFTIGGSGVLKFGGSNNLIEIKGNEIGKLNEGIDVANGFVNGKNDMLQVKCNNFENNRTDIIINQGCSIAREQGSRNYSAGNRFVGSNFNIRNSGDRFTYFYGTEVNGFPPNVQNVMLSESQFNGECDTIFDFLPPISNEDELNQLFDSLSLIKANLEGVLQTLIDSGQTSLIIAQVMNCDSSGKMPLYSQLELISPYLSESVLTAVCQRNDLFDKGEIVGLLSLNPDVLLKGDFLQFLNSMPALVDSNEIDSLVQLIYSTDRTALDLELSRVKENLSQVWLYGFDLLLGDTSFYFDERAIAQWMQKLKTSLSAFKQFGVYYDARDTAKCHQVIDSLASVIPQFQFVDSIEAISFIHYSELLLEALEAGKFEGELDSAQLQSMNQIALNGVGRPKLYAQNILEFYYNYSFSEQSAIQISPASANTERFLSQEYSGGGFQIASPEEQLVIYPNPARDYCTVKINACQDKKSAPTLCVYDLSGNRVITRELEWASPVSFCEMRLDLSNLSPGIYILKTLVQGQPVVHKLVKYD